MLDDWDRYFPNCEPIGHHLRIAFAERWVRFHSLPESKLYPENEAEYAEVLARHNAIMGELTHAGGSIALVTTSYSESQNPSRYYPEVVAFDPTAIPWRTVAMHRIDENFGEPTYWHLFASVREWQPARFDPLIRLVADDVVANVLVVALDYRWVLHPYDGGMDVIAESVEARSALRARHSNWLSARADGM